MPRGLTPEGKQAYRVIRQFLTARHLTHTDGCKAFYTPLAWHKKENPKLGVEGAVLVVVYSAGDLAKAFDPILDCSDFTVSVAEDLRKAGFWMEPIEATWSLIYRIESKDSI